MFSVPFICCGLCYFSLLLCTITRYYGICDSAFLWDSESVVFATPASLSVGDEWAIKNRGREGLVRVQSVEAQSPPVGVAGKFEDGSACLGVTLLI
ncbi:hypothetical protein TNCV_3054041 [Trichonephila clavipes]|nr:hypothetical protein TNCV_3054041 [Trichonephila clavipes]